MSYIIPITACSVIALLFTAHKIAPAVGKKTASKKSFFDPQALVDIIQQLIIVFLSAMLAMWLTQYAEKKNQVEHVQAFIEPMQSTCISQVSGISRQLNDITNTGKPGTDEQLMLIVEDILQNDSNLFDTLIYNENFVSVLDPISFLGLNNDFENLRLARTNLQELIEKPLDRQAICEEIARHLYHHTDAIFSMEFLKVDVTYDLTNLALVDDHVFQRNMFIKNYNRNIGLLQDHFSVDLGEWVGKNRYGKQTIETATYHPDMDETVSE